jgi:peptidoglycan/LPS O-acetylase OafA/YrhL
MHSISVPRASVLGNIFFIFNFMPQYGYFKGIIGASWFMGVLVPFYLLFPLIFRLSQKVSGVIWLFIISIIISCLFRTGILWLIGNGMEQKLNMLSGDLKWYGEFSLISNLPFFVMGIIAYHVFNISAKYERHKLLGGILLVLTIIAFIGLPNLSDLPLVNPVPLKYIIGLFFIPFTLSLAIHENRLFVNRFTVFMGKISYSLYLVHVFVILRMIPLYEKIYLALKSDWLAFICCYAMTLFIVTLISLFTYTLIELPGAKLGDLFNENLRDQFPLTSK